VQAVKVPVTVKTRLGWDEDSIIIEELALALQDVGIAALTIHGRTGVQMYKGEADWRPIAAVKANNRITNTHYREWRHGLPHSRRGMLLIRTEWTDL